MSPSTSTLPLTSLTLIACGIACTSRIAHYRGLDRSADFWAVGAQRQYARLLNTSDTVVRGGRVWAVRFTCAQRLGCPNCSD